MAVSAQLFSRFEVCEARPFVVVNYQQHQLRCVGSYLFMPVAMFALSIERIPIGVDVLDTTTHDTFACGRVGMDVSSNAS